MIRLAILIPTMPEREEFKNRVVTELNRQINQLPRPSEVVIMDNLSNRGDKTTGQKRNELIEDAVKAGAEYIAFMDDDDMPGPAYIDRFMTGIALGFDCCTVRGQYYENGKKGNPFYHYINCVNPANGKIEWWQDQSMYHRMPNHLNCIKLDLVKDIKFPDQVFGEDGQWSEKIRDAGVLKNEFDVGEIIYHYFSGNPKHEVK